MVSQLDQFQTVHAKIAYAHHLENQLYEADKRNKTLRHALINASHRIKSLEKELYLTRDERSHSYAQRLKKENYKLRRSIKKTFESKISLKLRLINEILSH